MIYDINLFLHCLGFNAGTYSSFCFKFFTPLKKVVSDKCYFLSEQGEFLDMRPSLRVEFTYINWLKDIGVSGKRNVGHNIEFNEHINETLLKKH